MRNGGGEAVWLYESRKQLVMALTCRSSVTLPVWPASHQPVALSKPSRAPKTSISISTFLFFLCLSCFSCPPPTPGPSSAVLLSPRSFLDLHPPWRHPLLLHRLPKLQPWRGTAVHQWTPLICLSWADTYTGAQSLFLHLVVKSFWARVQSEHFTEEKKKRRMMGVSALIKVMGGNKLKPSVAAEQVMRR